MDTFESFLDSGGPIRSRVKLLYDAGWAWVDARGIRLGAAVAYYGLFALIPVFVLAISLASLFLGEANVQAEVEAELTRILGADLAAQVMEMLGEMHVEASGALVSVIGFFVLLFAATLIFVAWKEVVDLMWGIPRERGARGLLRRRTFGVLAVLGAAILMTATLMLSTVVAILESIFDSELVGLLLNVSSSVLPLVLGVFFIGVLYRYTPDVHVRWSSVWTASIVAMVLLWIGSWAYGIYLDRFGFESATGIAGSAFFGLALVYYAAMILLYGMEIVRQVEAQSGTA